MAPPLERLLQLDELLRSPTRHTTPSLAEGLECSERTVRNDLAFLRDRFQAPLEYTPNKGFHYTNAEWRLPTVPLTQGELFALTLGARMVKAYAGTAYEKELQSAIAQLGKRLPTTTWVNLQELVEESVRFRAGAEIDLDPEIWHRLETACQQKRRVQMRYFTPERNAESDRQFDPYILHFSRNNPYVTGFCHLRQEVRWFRVDRIRSLELLANSFEIDPTFDPEEHLSMVFQYEVGGIPTEIAIWFEAKTAPYIRERRWHPTQKLEEHEDGSLTLRFISRGLNDVKRWVLYYGAGAKVMAPAALVELVRLEIQGMTNRYGDVEANEFEVDKP
ncbi:MAG: transcriptional regulator [Oscillatoriales cyanobacterium SM2_1_8]|nr:transcriptional regulator [Oscillatoriales cyanobacterium SM2_1_8]